MESTEGKGWCPPTSEGTACLGDGHGWDGLHVAARSLEISSSVAHARSCPHHAAPVEGGRGLAE